MVGFQVGYDQVVRGLSLQYFFQVGKPLFSGSEVYGVQDGGFFVTDDVGVVGYAVWDQVLAFEQVYGFVVCAYVIYGIDYLVFHFAFPRILLVFIRFWRTGDFFWSALGTFKLYTTFGVMASTLMGDLF